jgi:alkanesulfonate monooxygenase SsuD/methylene tetrahydromethanopterin reductase-like flavin-dependent oxidoreductase (luciferase family)
MQLGLLVEVEEGLTWEQLRRTARSAEQLGYVGLWLSDHLDSAYRPGAAGLETWTALAVIAAETRRIQLGPLVSPITFRPPALVFRMAAGLETLSDGRLILGLGAGWNAMEHQAHGIPFPAAAERMRMLEAALEVGRRQLPTVPILIGGGGVRRTLPLAAGYADEWNVTTADPDVFRAKSRRLDECCRARGRDPSTVRRSASVGFLIGRDDADLVRRAGCMRRVVPQLRGIPLADVPSAARAIGWVVGTVPDAAEHLLRLRAAGADRVMLNHYAPDDDDVLALIATEVAPALA